MKKYLIWLLIALALTAYGLVVYSWWLEGNARNVQEVEQHDATR